MSITHPSFLETFFRGTNCDPQQLFEQGLNPDEIYAIAARDNVSEHLASDVIQALSWLSDAIREELENG